jgi:hypothetical protein
MIDVPDGGLAGIFAGLMGLRRSVDAALRLLAQGFAGIVARFCAACSCAVPTWTP